MQIVWIFAAGIERKGRGGTDSNGKRTGEGAVGKSIKSNHFHVKMHPNFGAWAPPGFAAIKRPFIDQSSAIGG